MPHPTVSRLLRPASALLLSAAFLGGAIALGPVGCGKKTAGIKNADQPKAVKNALDGVWTLTLNPEVVTAGGQSKNVALSLATKRADAGGGTLSGTVAKSDFTDGRFMTGGDLTTARISFTSGDLMVPADEPDAAAKMESGPLMWKGELVDDDTLTGTVTGGSGGSKMWTAKKN